MNGTITQWLPIQQVSEEVAENLIRAFVDVFPNAVLLSGEHGNLILMGKNSDEKIVFDLDLVKRNAANFPKVNLDLKKQFLNPSDLAGSFMSGPEHLQKYIANAQPAIDDEPNMEYSQIFFVNSVLDQNLYNPFEFEQWCPKCNRSVYDNYSKILQATYQDLSFRLLSPASPPKPSVKFVGMKKAIFEKTANESPYLKDLQTRIDFSKAAFSEN